MCACACGKMQRTNKVVHSISPGIILTQHTKQPTTRSYQQEQVRRRRQSTARTKNSNSKVPPPAAAMIMISFVDSTSPLEEAAEDGGEAATQTEFWVLLQAEYGAAEHCEQPEQRRSEVVVALTVWYSLDVQFLIGEHTLSRTPSQPALRNEPAPHAEQLPHLRSELTVCAAI